MSLTQEDTINTSVGDLKASTLDAQFMKDALEVAYGRLCQKLKLESNPRISRGLKSLELSLNIDCLEGKELELLVPLLAGLRPARTVRLWTRDYEHKVRVQCDLPVPKVDVKEQLPCSKQPKLQSKIATALSLSVAKNSLLTHLYLFDTRFSLNGWQQVSKALFSSPQVETPALSLLLDALCALPKLHSLLLPGNDLKSPAGRYVARVIGFHGQRRDKEVWAHTLRGGGQLSGLQGLVELGLADSAVDDKSGEDLLQVLSTDVWVQSIDLQGNPLSEGVVKGFAKLHRTNPALRILDLRRVPAAQRLLPKVFARISRRMRRVKSDLESQFLSQKHQEMSENSPPLHHFPIWLLTRTSNRSSKVGSVSHSFVATAVSLPAQERLRAKSAGPTLKKPAHPQGNTQCLHCAAWQLQLRTAQARIALLEKQLEVPRSLKREAVVKGESTESLVLRAEKLVQELTDTLDLLDRTEGL